MLFSCERNAVLKVETPCGYVEIYRSFSYARNAGREVWEGRQASWSCTEASSVDLTAYHTSGQWL